MNKKTAVLLGLVLLAAAASAAAIFLPRAQGTRVVIRQNGQVCHEVRLDTLTQPETFHIFGENGEENLIQVEPGRVCMLSASCPDQVCVHQGYIDSGAVPIVCLPNQVAVTIEGGDDSLDVAAK